jgi:hypothetical protein
MVTRVSFDYALIFRIGTDASFRIETDVVLTAADGSSVPFRSASADVPAADLVGLFRKSVTKAWASDDGKLTIQFSGGVTLTATPDPDYEAWEIIAENGFRVICMPGGKLAIWDPR